MALKEENKQRVDFDDMEWGDLDYDGKRIGLKNKKLYSGYIVYDRFPNGNIENETEYRNGSHMGWENEYNSKGFLTYSCLTLGETSLEIFQYNDDGELTEQWKTVGDKYYDEMVAKYNLLD